MILIEKKTLKATLKLLSVSVRLLFWIACLCLKVREHTYEVILDRRREDGFSMVQCRPFMTFV